VNTETPLHRVLSRLDHVRASGDGYSARCPAHEDNVSSLSVSTGETASVVLMCHAGCDARDVVAAVGLTLSDLAGAPVRVASYPYHDLDGSVLYTVERWANPKTFRCVPELPAPAKRVLFAAQWISYARDTDQTLYVVEGEKDAVALIDRGIPATCNVLGAGKGKWLPQYSDQLAGCDVVVVADNDEPGKQHARTIADALRTTAKSVALTVPGYGKDISELFAAGYTLDHLLPLEADEGLPIVLAAHVRTRAVQWAWPGYIPLGKLTTIEGDPGDGKSTLTIDLVARWSTNAPMPDGVAHGGPYTAIMISAEDEPEDTVVPRLEAAGADRHRVHLLSAGADRNRPFNLGLDLDHLERVIMAQRTNIVVLDPLSSFLPDDTDSHSDHKIRRALYPLHLLARRTNVAIVAVRHLSKSATKAIYAGNGSIGIIAAARAAFLVGPVPGGGTTDRAFAPIKCNLSAKPPALGYRVEVHPRYGIGYVRWFGAVDMSAQEVMDGEKAQVQRDARDMAREYLTELLDRVPMTWREISARAKADGYSEHTLRDVRAQVLAKFINPLMPGGVRMEGTYWVRLDQANTFGDGFAGLPSFPGAENNGKAANPSPAVTPDTEPTPDDGLAELLEREQVCDVCGSPDATPFPRQRVIRCPAHDPRTETPE
jgi:hypothetical protein